MPAINRSTVLIFSKFGDFTAGRRPLNPVFQFKRVAFRHFRAGASQFNRSPGSCISGASACIMCCQPVFQVIGYPAIQRFIGTSDKVNNPFFIYRFCFNDYSSPSIKIRHEFYLENPLFLFYSVMPGCRQKRESGLKISPICVTFFPAPALPAYHDVFARISGPWTENIYFILFVFPFDLPQNSLLLLLITR